MGVVEKEGYVDDTMDLMGMTVMAKGKEVKMNAH